MRKKHVLICSIVTLLLLSHNLRAQTVSDLLQQLGIRDLADQYVHPAANAIGYSFNSGLYHTAWIDTSLHIYVGLKGIFTFIPNDDLSFNAKLPSYLSALGYQSEVSTATAFGGKGTVLHSNQKNPQGNPYPDISLPDGINTNKTFILLPHITLGSLFASEIMFRFYPPSTIDPSIGKMQLWGFGIKHSPTRYILLPVDVSFMVAYHKFLIGKVLNVDNYAINIHASKKFLFLTVYGGVGYEGYKIHASYSYTPTANGLPSQLNTVQDFILDFTGRNLRFTIGTNLELIPFTDVNIDYSFGVYKNLTFGAGISL